MESNGVPAKTRRTPIPPPSDTPIQVRAPSPSNYSPPSTMYGGVSQCGGCRGTGVDRGGRVCRVCRGRGYRAKPQYVCMHICGCERFTLVMVCDSCIDAVSKGIKCEEENWREHHSLIRSDKR